MFGSKASFHAEDQFFGKGVALAATINFENALGTGRTQHGLAVVIEAVEEFELEAGKYLTVTPSYASTAEGPFTEDKRSYTITYADATTFKPGDRIAVFNLCDMPEIYTKIKLVTDSAKTEKINCYLDYIAR